jgi:hypothetical protein
MPNTPQFRTPLGHELPGRRQGLPPGSLKGPFFGPHGDEHREPPPNAPAEPPLVDWAAQVIAQSQPDGAGEPPQSELQALVEAGGAVSDGTGLSAASTGAARRWRRWFRWR